MLRHRVEWVRQAFISYLKNFICCSIYLIHPHLSYYPISHHCRLLPPMPRDILPPVELVKGPHKCTLTEKAREAAEVPLKRVKLWPATMKTLVSTISAPSAASVKSSSSTVAIPVSIADSVESVSKRIRVCPSDYTNDDYDWGTDQYSSPLPAPSSPLPTSSPTPYETDDYANMINIDSKAEDVKPVESADEELGT
jgi:hypothetical protein